MRIRPISDVHTEFMRDHGQSFIEGLRSDDVDVLVLAGDICLAEQIPYVLGMFCAKFRHVVFTAGNHEFYGSTREEVLAQIAVASAANLNLHHLDKSMVEIDGVRFLGAPLWFGRTDKPKSGMNDFRAIKGGFTHWVYKESDEAVEFFDCEMREGDVVVTHHLPSYKSVAKEYAGSSLNVFFVRDIEAILLKHKPALVIHGHTHASADYQLCPGTRVVCNPFGYLRFEQNPRFDEELVLEVGVPSGS